MRPRSNMVRIWLAGVTTSFIMSGAARAQSDYPFRDPRLPDDQRIADLLGGLYPSEKVDLMSNHPKIAPLGIVFSGQVRVLAGNSSDSLSVQATGTITSSGEFEP